MKKISDFKFQIILLLFASSLPALHAATGAAFLKLSAGARAEGMGSAFTAVSDDASALYWNPAGTAGIAKRQAFLMHSEWLGDMKHEAAAFVQPFRFGTLGIGASYLAQGSYEGRDADRKPTGGFTASDTAFLLSGSKQISTFSLGMNLKLIRQNIESENAGGFAFDLGSKWNREKSPLSLGASLKNIGPKMKFLDESYDLPLSLNLGAAYKVGNFLTLSADASRPVDSGETRVSCGAEAWIFGACALRTGYLAGQAPALSGKKGSGMNFENMNGLRAGLGLRIFGTQLDYSIASQGELGSTSKISLLISF